ncbi:ABC transporter transmembrane domain-containing protein [Vagococcus entomophilus]|uniref:ABC transporter transmembrane domain-containing protein n=1 Tax=Vagococcus entomophilus TaxID=1160095 RepID=UPI0024829674|nr:ABC transporter ATP-binding protein [Vagococcus entomophilus]
MKEVKKERKFIIVTIFLVILGAITGIITPMIIQYYNEKNMDVSYEIMLIVFISMLVSFLVQIIMMIFRENFASKFNVNYLFKLINKLMNVEYNTFLEKESSYLINRILVAVDTLYLFIISSFPNMIKAIFTIVTALVIVFIVSKPIFWVLLFLLPINFFGYKYINKKLSKKMETMQAHTASANKDLIVTLSNIDNVKSQSSAEAIQNLLKPQIEYMYNTLANTNKYAQVSSTSISFINQVVQNLTYLWTSIMIINQTKPVGSLIILSILIPMYYSSLNDISKLNIDLKSLTTSHNFIQKELDEHSELDGNIEIDEINSIELKQPSFKLKEKNYNYDLSGYLKKGDVVYLEGESGSGKTSLLRLLLKFRNSTGIKINGHDINSIRNRDIRKNISYISQDPLILSTTLENNITMGKELNNIQKK